MKKNIIISKNSNFVFFVSLCFLFILFVFGWYQAPGLFIWGLYTDIDGQFCEWYEKALSAWSIPFSISNINPFGGMGSLFFPNNIWLNPGALVLSLPMERIWTYVLSYSIYLLEVSISIYFLSRALGLSRIQSVFALQIFAFFLFPPFTAYTHAMSFFSAAPFNAHLLSILNFCLILFIKIRNDLFWSNVKKIALISALFFVAIYSGAFTTLTFLPFFSIFALGCLVQNLSHSSKKIELFLWKMAPIIVILSAGLILDSYSYFLNTSQYVARSLINYDEPIRGSLTECFRVFLQTLSQYDVNAYPQVSLFFFKANYPISIFHAFAVLGGIIGYFIPRYRWIAAGFVCLALLPDFLIILIKSQIFPKLEAIFPSFFLWSSYAFYAIFFVIFFEGCWRFFKWLLKSNSFSNLLIEKINLYVSNNIFMKKIIIFIIPTIGVYVFVSIKLYEPYPLLPPEKTPIIEYLEKTIKLQPGSTFKGYAISYLAAKEGGIRPNLSMYNNDINSYELYSKSRDYLKKHYNNWHMLSDLWGHSIPTLEEYGQWITIPLFVFVAKMLANPEDKLFDSNINIFSLDFSILKLLGVRFIITDSQLNDHRVRKVTQIVKIGAVPLYLYEIVNPNLGNYSPTHVMVYDSAQEIFDLFKQGNFNFEKSVVVQMKNLPKNLSVAYEAEFSFGKNKIGVKAKSKGFSLIVLPLQFSHCYKVHNEEDNPDIKVIRANIVQTGILFKDDLDTEMFFNFGVSRNAKCRAKDVQDINALGLQNYKHPAVK